jgi:nucleoid-associated protein YgaU
MSDDPAQDAGQVETQDDRTEYLKFVAFLAVLLIVVLAIALITPSLFENVIPSILGLNATSSSESVPAAGDADIAPESGMGGEPVTADTPELLHTVQEGETLNQIAETYGVTVEAIAATNHLISIQQITPGTVLVIPTQE